MATQKPIKGLTIKQDNLASLLAGLKVLTEAEVMVGVPDENADRKDEDPGVPTNAALAYIHDTGMPEQNIPARPFMVPGIESAKDRIATQLFKYGRKVVDDAGAGKNAAITAAQGLHAAGLVASTAIKRKINEGIPPPLADSTLKRRASKGRKGAQKELALRALGEAPGTDLAKPLIDTGELRNSITYVLRKRADRK